MSRARGNLGKLACGLGVALALMLSMSVRAEDLPPALDGIDRETPADMTPAEEKLVYALKDPMLQAMNVEQALEAWFAGREAFVRGKTRQAAQLWSDGLAELDGLERLPKAEWDEPPDCEFDILEPLHPAGFEDLTWRIVAWEVDGLRQYGVLVAPCSARELEDADVPGEKAAPLLLYLHGAAFGVPVYALPWLGRIARAGYIIIGPALRGENLFAGARSQDPLYELSRKYRSEGRIENLDGEVNDALGAVSASKKLPVVNDGPVGVIGHSFGAGVGLLVAARSKDVACVVSYDAWLVNPFRYYWDRLRRGPNNWLSWAAYCTRPVSRQLAGLMTRSITHHAERIHAPLLLFIGGAYKGSVFHKSHDDFIRRLSKHGKDYEYNVVPGGGHNFVLYESSRPARTSFRRHMAFLRRHLPPAGEARQAATSQ